MELQCLDVFLNEPQLLNLRKESSFPVFHVFFIHVLQECEVFFYTNVASVIYLVSEILKVEIKQILSLLEDVHFHTERLVFEFLYLVPYVESFIEGLVDLEMIAICSHVVDFGLFK